MTNVTPADIICFLSGDDPSSEISGLGSKAVLECGDCLDGLGSAESIASNAFHKQILGGRSGVERLEAGRVNDHDWGSWVPPSPSFKPGLLQHC